MAATLTSTGVNFSDGSTINGTTPYAIGSYLFCTWSSSTSYGSVPLGTSIPGSQLRNYYYWALAYCCGYYMSNSTSSVSASGTWKYIGNTGYGGSIGAINLWVRVA